MMMDKNCASNLMTCDGLGADNMTCIIVEFTKQAPTAQLGGEKKVIVPIEQSKEP